jgi:glycosyltransferase involved in cell wall biosynthesis
MRVLVISEHYYPTIGGSTNYVHNLCRFLTRIGCEVYLITIPDREDPVERWYTKDGFQIFRLRIPKSLRKERFFPIFLGRRLGGIISDVNPEIIHFAYGFFAPLVTRTCLRRVSTPILWTIHNIPPLEHTLDTFKNTPLNRTLERIYFSMGGLYGFLALKLSYYDILICVSEKTANHVMEKKVPLEKIRIIPNGIDTELFSAPEDSYKIKEKLNIQNYSPIILTVAGIIPHKGQDYLIRIAPRLLERFPEALFLFVGPVRSRSYFHRLQELIESLNVQDNVMIIPSVEASMIQEYYSAADIYVQPSLEEGFCMSILEAMACEKPVVGTKTGAIPKFIEESGAGILIDRATPTDIYNAIITLLENEKKLRDGKKARAYVVKNYSWKKIAEMTFQVYKELLK